MAADEAGSGIGHNSGGELTDAQLEVLFFDHFRKVKALKEKVATATADLRNAYKAAKADSIAKKDLDFALSLEGDDDHKHEAEHRRREQIARWMGLPFGSQPDLFDGAPLEDRAFAEGRIAGMKGLVLQSPYHEHGAEQKWIEGWHAGQAAIMEIRAPLLNEDGSPKAQSEKPKGRGKKAAAKDGDEKVVSFPATPESPHQQMPAAG